MGRLSASLWRQGHSCIGNARHIAMAWRAPSAEEENGDGDALAGRRVRVAGFGEGTVLGFRRCVANYRG